VLGRLDPAVLDRLVAAGTYPAPDVDVARALVQNVLAHAR